MPKPTRRVRGLSLVELLLAVTYLALCASSILACVTSAAHRTKEVEQREQVLAYATSQFESLAANTRRPGAAALVNSTTISVSGIPNPITLSRRVETVVGHSELFFVEVVATWTVSSSANNRGQAIRLATYMRSPYG